MLTISQNLALIRALLDEPNPAHPSDRILFDLISNQVQHHLTQLQNSGAPWGVSEWILTTSDGNEDYLIAAQDFGKPFLVYWQDPTDQYQSRVEIPFSLLQNASQFYEGPRRVYSTTNNIPTAAVVTFYKRDGNTYARFTPIPGGSAEYHIWYEVAPKEVESLGDTPGLSPFHHLIRIQAAIAALPYCWWGDVKVTGTPTQMRQWQMKTEALALAFTRQETQFQKEFSTYIGTLMQAGVESRDGYGAGYDDDWSLGIGYFGPNQLG